MLFMNRWEVEDAVREFEDDPVLGPGARTLQNLMEWTDRNSDGWAYWPKPCRAAARLQELLQLYAPFRVAWDQTPATVEQLQVAIKPIKAFRTRQRADFEIVEA